jgi:hypothetical protein
MPRRTKPETNGRSSRLGTSWISLGLAVAIGTVLALADLWADSQLWPNAFAQLPRRWPAAVLFGLPLILWLVAAWLSRPVPVLGPFSLLMMVIVIGQISSLFLVAVVRMPRLRTAIRLVAEMLEHWHRYGRDRLYPPWVFQSPIWSQPTRALLMGAAIASMSIAIVPLFLVEVTLPALAQGSGDGFPLCQPTGTHSANTTSLRCWNPPSIGTSPL